MSLNEFLLQLQVVAIKLKDSQLLDEISDQRCIVRANHVPTWAPLIPEITVLMIPMKQQEVIFKQEWRCVTVRLTVLQQLSLCDTLKSTMTCPYTCHQSQSQGILHLHMCDCRWTLLAKKDGLERNVSTAKQLSSLVAQVCACVIVPLMRTTVCCKICGFNRFSDFHTCLYLATLVLLCGTTTQESSDSSE